MGPFLLDPSTALGNMDLLDPGGVGAGLRLSVPNARGPKDHINIRIQIYGV